ncbi:MAG: DUF3365 domain-containing protein [Gemmataceae bacterium]
MKLATMLHAVLVAWLLGTAGCSQGPATDESWKPVASDSLTASQKTQKEEAIAAKETMFKRLMAKLMKELSSGPAHAIGVCQDEAPRIAREVGTENRVRIGRTALKLRNANNQAPEWAKGLVEKRIAEPTFLANGRGDFAALLPIRLQPPCLLCHGDHSGMSGEVLDALAKRYPNDQATGFREGDLRGWFWVEVPAR